MIESTEQAPWIQAWRNLIMQAPFSPQPLGSAAEAVIDAVLLAIERGDSCVPCTAQQVEALQNLVSHADEQKITPFIHDGQALYLQRYWALEANLAKQVARLSQHSVNVVATQAYQQVFPDNPEQQQALNQVLQQGFSFITGGPGTGKTYTLARIVAILSHEIPDLRIALAAPTGKAAQRMQEALQHAFQAAHLPVPVTEDLKQLKPITIHRLLGLGMQKVPKFHAEQALPYDLIVVDEASMLDLTLANMLLSAVSSQARLILLGDANQLASVDVGAVLADLQQVDALNVHQIHLKQTRRFKDDAAIKAMADFIQQAQLQPQHILSDFEQQVVAPQEIIAVPISANMQDVVQLQYLKDAVVNEQHYDQLMFGFSSYVAALQAYIQAEDRHVHVPAVIQAFDEYRILTAVRHGALGLHQVNRQIEQRLLAQLKPWLQRHGDWYVGRAVMMTYNDYQIGLSNGDIGICLQRFKEEHAEFEVYFPSLDRWFPATRLPRNIETAFALTIHKSQGSEFNHTAVVFDQHAEKLLSKELLYTAITRAKNVVSLLVTPSALQQALWLRTCRHSGLSGKIKALLSA